MVVPDKCIVIIFPGIARGRDTELWEGPKYVLSSFKPLVGECNITGYSWLLGR